MTHPDVRVIEPDVPIITVLPSLAMFVIFPPPNVSVELTLTLPLMLTRLTLEVMLKLNNEGVVRMP